MRNTFREQIQRQRQKTNTKKKTKTNTKTKTNALRAPSLSDLSDL